MGNRREFVGLTLGVGVGAALALALSIAAPVRAQQAQPDPASLTDAQAAGVQRLKQVIEALNTGDYATIRAYFEANSLLPPAPPGAKPPKGLETVSWGVPQFSQALTTYRHSRGLDLVRVTTVPARGDVSDVVAGIVRNRTTGDEDYLAVRVEPQAPHRIIQFPVVDPEVRASWKLKLVTSVAVTEQERLEEIGSYLKRLGDTSIFSGAVIIARDGKPVFAQAYGYADREKKIPNTLETPFLIASMTKLFTGLAIGQLVEQGKLSYEDPLAKFLPEFPDPESAGKITIKHLLSHTSGLGDFLGTKAFSDALDRMTSVKAIVDVFERKPPAFEPGTKWAYSNMGYELLGRVIEIVTGQDYYDYMQQHVFAPAGATSASFPLLPANGVALMPMAYPYESRFDAETLREDPFVNQLGKGFRRGSAAGSSILSALDLIKLSNAMNAGRIVRPETLRLHSTPKPELGATVYGYGFITRARRADRPLVGHGGNTPGTCTEFGELKDTPYTIVVLSNLTINTCMAVTERILRVLRPSVAGVFAQNKPDFTGTWRIDPARSDQVSGGALAETITVEGSTMTVTRSRAGNSEQFVYRLDGTPTKSVVGPLGQQLEQTYTSTWDGNVLVTTILFPQITRIEKRSIQADGTMMNELTIIWKDGRPTNTARMVFNKVKQEPR